MSHQVIGDQVWGHLRTEVVTRVRRNEQRVGTSWVKKTGNRAKHKPKGTEKLSEIMLSPVTKVLPVPGQELI